MQLCNCWRWFAVGMVVLIMLGLLGPSPALWAQTENDFPLPLAPTITTGNGPEPVIYMGDYCSAFGGVSLHDTEGGPGSFTVDVVGTPVQAFFIWSGRNLAGRAGDDSLQVSLNGSAFVNIVADQSLLANSDGGYSWYTYSYDALAGGLPIQPGANKFIFQGLGDGKDTFEAHGVGVLIIGEDHVTCPFQALGIYFGNDVLFHNWDGVSGPNSQPICFSFPPPPVSLEMDIQLFVGGVENPYRANAIWSRTGNGALPANIVGDPAAVERRMALRGLQGDEFDNYDTVNQDPNPIVVDAGDTWACVQIESPPEVHNQRFPELIVDGVPLPEEKRQGISATWITHAMRVPLAEIEIGPDGLNRVGETHEFTVTVNSTFGFAGSLVITPSVVPSPDFLTHTCDAPTITGGVATCVVTINNAIPGVFTANAAAAIGLGNGLVAELSTEVARESSGGPAIKEYVAPAIDIEKSTNGEDADVPTGPIVPAGDLVTWRYRVENGGGMDLINVVVTDDNGTPRDRSDDFNCDIGALAAGAIDETSCVQRGTAAVGQYGNIASVIGTPVIGGAPHGDPVTDKDPSHYFGAAPAIDIEKATNGKDADRPTGPYIPLGNTVTWSYRVENTGGMDLINVVVTDDNGTSSDPTDDFTCDIGALTVGAVDLTNCVQRGVAVAGQYGNVATVTGTPVIGNQPYGDPVTDRDPSHYFGAIPAIDIEKATNGKDADLPPGPEIGVGETVSWTYLVKNTGNVPLRTVSVSDNRGVAVNCPQDVLDAGKEMLCSGQGVAVFGRYSNIGTVTGISPSDERVSDWDPSHYIGAQPGAIDDTPPSGPGTQIFLPMIR